MNSVTHEHRILEQAAEWFASMQDGELSEPQKQAWQAWLQADPRHLQAWQRVELVMQRFHTLDDPLARDMVRHPGSRRRVLKAMLALGGVSVLSLSWWQAPAMRQWSNILLADHGTQTGERQRVMLADGGQLWLNSASAVNINYKARERLIELISGEVWIETARDTQPPPRPLSVHTRHGVLTALGTRFAVRDQGQVVHVAVFEGAVEVRPHHGLGKLVVGAGRQASFNAGQSSPIQAADPAMQSWLKGMLVADNLPLAEVVGWLGSYFRGHLACDPAVATLRVVGAFPLDDLDRVLHTLAQTLPIKVNRLLPWWITLEPLDHVAHHVSKATR